WLKMQRKTYFQEITSRIFHIPDYGWRIPFSKESQHWQARGEGNEADIEAGTLRNRPVTAGRARLSPARRRMAQIAARRAEDRLALPIALRPPCSTIPVNFVFNRR